MKLVDANREEPRTITSKSVHRWDVAEIQAPPHLTIPRHGHDFAALAFVFHGGSTVERGSETDTLTGPVIEYMPAGEEHVVRYGERGERLLVAELIAQPSELVLPATRTVLRDAGITHMAWHLLEQYRYDDQYADLALQGLLACVSALVARHEATDKRYPAWLHRVVAMIHDERRARISVADMAREARCTPSHLTRTFQRYLGCSPSEYQVHVRLDRARVALHEGDAAVADVAISTGFSDHSHFTRVFRKHYGMTPTESRRLFAPRVASGR